MAPEIGSLIIQGTLWIKKKISVEDKQKIWQKKNAENMSEKEEQNNTWKNKQKIQEKKNFSCKALDLCYFKQSIISSSGKCSNLKH